MALYTYMQDTQRLLGDFKQRMVNQADIHRYVNIARKQVAGQSESIRHLSPLALTGSTDIYPFSSLNLGSGNGINKAINARMISLTVAGGLQMLHAWPWEWFNLYYLSRTGVSQAAPTQWAQYGQGDAGSIVFFPTPDQAYTVIVDAVCLPSDLADDTTVEALPYPWTDCVAYYAAYQALLSEQGRDEEANKMFQRYEEFVSRARRMSTASVLPAQFEQGPRIIPPTSAGGTP